MESGLCRPEGSAWRTPRGASLGLGSERKGGQPRTPACWGLAVKPVCLSHRGNGAVPSQLPPHPAAVKTWKGGEDAGVGPAEAAR